MGNLSVNRSNSTLEVPLVCHISGVSVGDAAIMSQLLYRLWEECFVGHPDLKDERKILMQADVAFQTLDQDEEVVGLDASCFLYVFEDDEDAHREMIDSILPKFSNNLKDTIGNANYLQGGFSFSEGKTHLSIDGSLII